MRYFGQNRLFPFLSQLACQLCVLHRKKLVINGLKIMFVFRDPNETLNVQNFVPREVEVLETPADTVTPLENS